MLTKTETKATAFAKFANFPRLIEQEFSVVPATLIQPTPSEMEIIRNDDLEPLTSLADSTIEPIQHWVQVPTGEYVAMPLVMVTCATCYSRYTTPGTQYYMNQTLLNQCLSTPCT